MTLWQASCLANAVLMGLEIEPVCSRVYRSDESLVRTAYITAVDKFFDRYEEAHCQRIYQEFMWVFMLLMIAVALEEDVTCL